MGTAGIHHVTAICGDAQRNVDFYAGVLGLRLVKRTVNFDDPRTWHLYYGDEVGRPGSLITFFPWPNAPRGRLGPGQIAVTSFAVAASAIGFWIERLLRFGVKYHGPSVRRERGLDHPVLSFEDGDGLKLELLGTSPSDDREGWSGAPGIASGDAIRGIHGVTLWEEDGAAAEPALADLLGLDRLEHDGATQRFGVGHSIVDVRTTGGFPHGRVSVGTVHHVAWRVSDANAQLQLRDRITAGGLHPTPVIDRQYFQSVYFREPGGVLFELATDGPGFAIDEPPDRLGESLRLPPQFEPNRDAIIAGLPEIHMPESPSATYRDE
jgi:glyoxalase family protein